MPRYFFNIDDGKRHIQDDEGWECSGLREACVIAIRTLPDIARDAVLDSGQQDLVATIRDADDQMLLRVTLSLRTEWLLASKGQAIGLEGSPFAARLGSVEPTE